MKSTIARKAGEELSGRGSGVFRICNRSESRYWVHGGWVYLYQGFEFSSETFKETFKTRVCRANFTALSGDVRAGARYGMTG